MAVRLNVFGQEIDQPTVRLRDAVAHLPANFSMVYLNLPDYASRSDISASGGTTVRAVLAGSRMPVQRAPRYELFLKELLKQAKAKHSSPALSLFSLSFKVSEQGSIVALEKAVTKLTQVVGHLNESTRKAENVQTLMKVRKKLKGAEEGLRKQFFKASRVLVNERT